MRVILLTIIKLYWKIIPIHKRKKCLFKVSCSQYVYKKTKKRGCLQELRHLFLGLKIVTQTIAYSTLKTKKY